MSLVRIKDDPFFGALVPPRGGRRLAALAAAAEADRQARADEAARRRRSKAEALLARRAAAAGMAQGFRRDRARREALVRHDLATRVRAAGLEALQPPARGMPAAVMIALVALQEAALRTRPVTLDATARQALTREQILADICAEYGVSEAEIHGKRRGAGLRDARKALAYRVMAETGTTFPELGRWLDKDPTSVRYSARTWAEAHGLPQPWLGAVGEGA